MNPLILLALLLVCLPLGYLAWTFLSADKKGRAATAEHPVPGQRTGRGGQEGTVGIHREASATG